MAAPENRVELATLPLQSDVDLGFLHGRWRWRLPRDGIGSIRAGVGAGAGASCIANGAGAGVNCWELRDSCFAVGTSDGGASVTGTPAATSVATSRRKYRKP